MYDPIKITILKGKYVPTLDNSPSEFQEIEDQILKQEKELGWELILQRDREGRCL